MKNLLFTLTCLALLFANSARADEVPYFANLRSELVSQLTLASNTMPVNKKLMVSLRSSLKLVDRTKTNLISGSSALSTLAKSLGRTSLSNTFHPILTDTRAVYLEVIGAAISPLESRLADTIPGKAKTAARKSIDKTLAILENAETNAIFSASLRSLGKAATGLSLAQRAVARAETARPGRDFLLATITEPNHGTNRFIPGKGLLDATYDPLDGNLNIEFGIVKSLGKRRTLIRFLSLNAIITDTGTYTLSLTNDNEGYALYQRAVVVNINAEEPEVESEDLYLTIEPFNRRLGTGTLTIKVDLEAKIVWGSFEFTALHTENPELEVAMTGSFLVRLFIYNDEEFE